MDFRKKAKRSIFSFSVKTPFAALLIIFLTSLILLLISYVSYTDIYFKTSGELASSNNEIYIKSKINSPKIKKQCKAIWYVDVAGVRYQGIIIDIQKQPDSIESYAIIKPQQDDIIKQFGKVEGLLNKSVNVEISLGRDRIINKLLGAN